MNKYIFDDIVYEDLDIYNNIIKEYNIQLYESNIYTEDILHQIYLLKKDINNHQKNIKNINIKISLIKNTFINDTHKWTLNDSCNKKILKNKIKNILEIHAIISELKYNKADIEKIIKNNINNINTKIKELTKKNSVPQITNNNDDYDDYDEFNSIING